MSAFLSPTKGNLINAKKSLQLSKLGFDLMDKKRNILIREMMPLVEVAKSIREEVETTFKKAYKALQKAKITGGFFDFITNASEIETGITIEFKTVMGIEIPKVKMDSNIKDKNYLMLNTNSFFDIAYISFLKAKEIRVILAEIENSIYTLAKEIKETKIRANALLNIVIDQVKKT